MATSTLSGSLQSGRMRAPADREHVRQPIEKETISESMPVYLRVLFWIRGQRRNCHICYIDGLLLFSYTILNHVFH